MDIFLNVSEARVASHKCCTKKELCEAIKISTICIKDDINWFVFLKENLLDR